MNNNYQNNPTFDQAAQFCLSMIGQLNTLRKFNPSTVSNKHWESLNILLYTDTWACRFLNFEIAIELIFNLQ